MNSDQRRTWVVALVVAAAAGCSAGELTEVDELPAAERAASPAGVAAADHPALPTVEQWEALVSRVEARVDSVDRTLVGIPNLRGSEQGLLRRDVNATHTARARALGIRRGADVEGLQRSGQLRELAPSTRFWIVRDLTYSVPLVTPDTEALLAEIGERWLASMDSLGLPPYRLEITSVLRTPADQARLRRSNPNAAAGESSHEFGTTVDIAYRRFAPPIHDVPEWLGEAHPAVQPQLRLLHDLKLGELAANRGTEMQAVLGRILLDLRREGKVLVIMERQQTVYHMTVARRMPGRDPVPAE